MPVTRRMGEDRQDEESQPDPRYSVPIWQNNKNYNYVSDEGEIVSIQSINVVLAGADPHVVFEDEYVVHHRMPSPVPLDVPGNLEVLSDSDHRRLHAEGYEVPSIEDVLAPNDEPDSIDE